MAIINIMQVMGMQDLHVVTGMIRSMIAAKRMSWLDV